ncbi:GNAT family N-acetyltransferase [Umezawaea sp. Da 62-37]|uniref:GNAT family N-acetyltransferase n=1 Tax=Umezawaea sp. Da 62-37 TaxID=3075927 RepID=UPI0028F6FD51|nr:GNAT family N-acetyltransferase [Umezawaea sp. Da 62-37]WNV82117.1 GNAT family N-acetyltransferase [Umezawaea sp. Da 62-37]
MSTITTARLSLVPWRDEHLVDLMVLASDERVVRLIGDGKPWNRDYATDRHRAVLAHWRRHGYGWRAVLDRKTGIFSGVGSMVRHGVGEIELGWWIAPAAWGRGLATEVAGALRDDAFKQHGARLVVAQHQDGNDASGRVMAKIGLVHDRSVLDDAQGGRLLHVYVGGPDSAA